MDYQEEGSLVCKPNQYLLLQGVYFNLVQFVATLKAQREAEFIRSTSFCPILCFTVNMVSIITAKHQLETITTVSMLAFWC